MSKGIERLYNICTGLLCLSGMRYYVLQSKEKLYKIVVDSVVDYSPFISTLDLRRSYFSAIPFDVTEDPAPQWTSVR